MPVTKIGNKASPQRWRFSLALKREEKKHEQILHENIYATPESYPQKNCLAYGG